MVKEPRWNAISNPRGYARRMTEKERIDFIREYGSEQQKKFMDSVFGRNKYEPKRKWMWKNQLDKGRRAVETIIARRIGELEFKE